MKDWTIEAVEEMIKYIYTGDISEEAEELSADLLQLLTGGPARNSQTCVWRSPHI